MDIENGHKQIFTFQNMNILKQLIQRLVFYNNLFKYQSFITLYLKINLLQQDFCIKVNDKGKNEICQLIKQNKIKQNLQLNSKSQNLSNYNMKSQNRRLLHQPMKSPSPDIVNRSIITNTKSPANQIKQFIKMRQNSTSPKSLTTSFHQISKSFVGQTQQNKRLKKVIQQLQKRIQYLQKIRISHDQITIINQRLTAQLQQLKQKVTNQKQTYRSGSNSPHNLSPKSTKVLSPKGNGKGVSLVRQALQNIKHQIPTVPPPNSNDNILRQFNQRMIRMSDQNKRLQIRLKQNKQQKDILELQLMRLRNQKHFEKFNHSPHLEIANLKRHFAEQTDKIIKHYQRINEGKVIQINLRMGKVEQSFSKIAQKQHQTNKSYYRTNSPHQLKTNISVDTNVKSDYQQHQPTTTHFGNRYDMVQSKYTTSPSQVRAFTLDTSPVRALEQQKFKIKNQNQRLSRRVSQLQVQLKKTMLAYNQLQKNLEKERQQKSKRVLNNDQQSNKMSRFYQQKSESLESQLNKKISQLEFKQVQTKQFKNRIEQLDKFIQEQLFNYEKNVKQEKDKNKHYQRQLKMYQQKLKSYQDQIKQLQIKYGQKQMAKYKELEHEFNQIKDSYCLMERNFEKYLEMVLQIRYSITGNQVDKCLNQAQNKWEGYDQLQIQILRIHQSYQSIIQNLKKNILQKDHRVSQLQQNNHILNQTVRQLNLQKKQLQNAILQYNKPIQGKLSYQQIKKRVISHQSASKSKQRCQIRQYINRTVSKIGNLQKQIDVAIKTHQKPQNYFKIRTQQNKHYFTQQFKDNQGVNADDRYRSIIKQKAKHTVSITHGQEQGSQHLQDPSLLQDQGDQDYYRAQKQ